MVSGAVSDVCQTCNMGTFSLPGSSNCQPCGPGTWSSVSGASTCVNCPGGTFSLVLGAISQDVCFGCPVGTYAIVGSGQCVNCNAGVVVNIRSELVY